MSGSGQEEERTYLIVLVDLVLWHHLFECTYASQVTRADGL